MLMFTNRTTVEAADESAWTTHFSPCQSGLAMADVVPAPSGATATSDAWRLQRHAPAVDDATAGHALVELFSGDRPVLVYLHGNNNTPAALFSRCALLERLYGTAVVGFSWPSEGLLHNGVSMPTVAALPDQPLDENELSKVRSRHAVTVESAVAGAMDRYRQAKVNASQSIQAFERFARLLALARLSANRQPVTVAAHSLGAFLLQNALSLPGAAVALGAAQNVVLLAACCASAGHAQWLQLLHPAGQLVVTVNQGDSVLLGARIADRGEAKLGAEPGQKLIEQWVRYAHVDGAKVGRGGHGYFAQDAMPADLKRLFLRIFSSQRDLGPGERPGTVYLGECDADGVTCRMRAPKDPGAAGPSQ